MTEPPRHDPPYPGPELDRRLGRLESWRAGVDEWRRSIDSWRQTIEREGIAVALARLDGRVGGIERSVEAVRSNVGDLRQDVEPLILSGQRRQGVVLTFRGAAAAVGVLASVSAIIGTLVVILSR